MLVVLKSCGELNGEPSVELIEPPLAAVLFPSKLYVKYLVTPLMDMQQARPQQVVQRQEAGARV